jgi:hypothetical protein
MATKNSTSTIKHVMKLNDKERFIQSRRVENLLEANDDNLPTPEVIQFLLASRPQIRHQMLARIISDISDSTPYTVAYSDFTLPEVPSTDYVRIHYKPLYLAGYRMSISILPEANPKTACSVVIERIGSRGVCTAKHFSDVRKASTYMFAQIQKHVRVMRGDIMSLTSFC